MASVNNGRSSEPEDAVVQEYGRRYRAWQAAARKILAAQNLIELAGGYDEAFVLLDAVIFTEVDATDVRCRPGSGAENRPERDYGERMRQCQATARQVLAARRLFELAADQQEAFMLLDAVLIATEGEHAHRQAGERHSVSARHHEGLSEEGGGTG